MRMLFPVRHTIGATLRPTGPLMYYIVSHPKTHTQCSERSADALRNQHHPRLLDEELMKGHKRYY